MFANLCDCLSSSLIEFRRSSIGFILFEASAKESPQRLLALGAALAAILLSLPACARVESIDQFGNRKVGWLVGSSIDLGDGKATTLVNTRGLGWHRVGDTWSVGAYRSQAVAIAADCQVVILDDNKTRANGAKHPADIENICRQKKEDVGK